MIAFLRGRLLRKLDTHAILDVQGVGYGVELNARAFSRLPPLGSELELWIYTRMREDDLRLYGFLELEERRAFEILLEVNGVGPKVALAILSTLTIFQLIRAVEQKECEILMSVPGIGKRTAEKILLELSSKVEKLALSTLQALGTTQVSQGLLDPLRIAEESLQKDLISALENLGFKKKDFIPIVEKVLLQFPQEEFSQLMKKVLAFLRPMDVRSPRDLDAMF